MAFTLLLTGCPAQVTPPVAVLSAPDRLVVGQAIRLNGADSHDPQGRPLVFRWQLVSVPSGSLATVIDQTTPSAAFTPDQPGKYVVALMVNNGLLSSEPSKLNVNVLPCGVASPAVSAVNASPEAANAGQPITLSATVSDADNDPACELDQKLRFEWSIASAPPGSNAPISDPHAEQPSLTPDVVGTYQVQLVVTDSTGRSSPPTFVRLTTTRCGILARPHVTASASASSPVIGQTVTLTAVAVDADNGPGCDARQDFSYQWALLTRPSGSSASLSDPTAAAPVFQPDVPGPYDFSVVATDSTGLRSESVAVRVITAICGQATPSVAVFSQTQNPNITQTVQLSAFAADGDNEPGCGLNQALTYSWSIRSAPAGSIAALSSASAATPTFTPDVPGRYLLSVIATDPTGRKSPAAVLTIETSSCGTAAPSVRVAASASNPNIGQPVTITAVGADADNGAGCNLGQTFTYAWTMLARPVSSTAALAGTASATSAFTPDVVGTYQLEVVASDSTGRSSSPARVEVTTSSCGNAAPTAAVTVSNLRPNITQPIVLQSSVSDADNEGSCNLGQSFTHSWSLVSRPAASVATLSSANAAAPSFTPDAVGTYQFQLVARDSTGRASSPVAVTVQTTACGDAVPVVTAASASPTAPTIGTFVALSATASDSDNDPSCGLGQSLAPQWTVVARPPQSSAALTGAATLTPTFTPDQPGTYQFSVTVTDVTGRVSAPQVMTLSTSSCGTARPVVERLAFSGGDAWGNPVPGATVVLSAQISDADNLSPCSLAQSVGYAWTVASRPAGSTAALVNANSASPGFTVDVLGTYAFDLSVTDSGGYRSLVERLMVGECADFTPSALVAVSAPVTVAAGVSVSGTTQVGDAVQLSGAASVNPTAGSSICSTTPLQYEWTFTALPRNSTATLNSPSVVNPSFTPDVPGLYVAQLQTILGARRSVAAVVTVEAVRAVSVVDVRVGPFTSLALDSANGARPVIAYYDTLGGTIRVARCLSGDCSDGRASWSYLPDVAMGLPAISSNMPNDPRPLAVVVSPTLTGGYGTPIVAYQNASSCGSVRIATWNGTGWTTTVVAGGGALSICAGRWLSLALDGAGNPAVAYLRTDTAANNTAPAFAYCMGQCFGSAPAWSTPINVETPVAAATVGLGSFVDLKFTTTGHPRLAYYSGTTGAGAFRLRYAACDKGAATLDCTAAGSFVATLVDDGNGGARDVGRYASLALNAAQQPRISYRDEDGRMLMFAVCANAVCSSPSDWSRRVAVPSLPGSTDVGAFTSLALDGAGNPRISFYDVGGGRLAFASSDGGPFSSTFLDATTDTGRHNSLVLSPNGRPRVSYYDSTAQEVRLFSFGQ